MRPYDMVNVSIVMLMFFIIFGILGRALQLDPGLTVIA